MRNYSLWILAIVALSGTVGAVPLSQHRDQWRPSTASDVHLHPRYQHPQHQAEPGVEVLSTRVTSSVAVNRPHRKYRSKSRSKSRHHPPHLHDDLNDKLLPVPVSGNVAASEVVEQTEIPPELAGANIEYIKQLNAKKEVKSQTNEHPFYLKLKKNSLNDSDEINDSAVDESEKVISQVPIDNYEVSSQYSEDVPLARSVPFSPSPINLLHNTRDHNYHDRKNSPRLTTAVSFNIVHDNIHTAPVEVTSTVTEASTVVAETQKPVIPAQPLPFYQEQAKVYSQPAKVYSVPAKFYSEPAKIYSEPAKVYGEPAKVYGEPAKIYSEPAKFYSKPASLHLDPEPQVEPPTSTEVPTSSSLGTTETSTPVQIQLNDTTLPTEEEHEKNYEVDEKVSVNTEGKMHGIQENGDDCKHDNCKVGYVVEGRQYRKYRVEERTSDGYIVGEYGVVRNEDGALRGVRYTADSEASPRLIYDALMKFLQL